VVGLAWLTALLFVLHAAPFSVLSADDPTPAGGVIYLPFVLRGPVGSDRIWDPRLTQRGAALIPAAVQPGQGYWRLVKGVWYAENEPPFAGQHHIFVDTLGTDGQRRTNVPIQITSLDGQQIFATLLTEAKPGELYAANFPMYVVAPAYRAVPADGNPADAVTGMGLGSIELPDWKVHTSYGLTWQWVVAPVTDPTPTPTLTSTPTPTPTPTPTMTSTPDVSATPTPTFTPDATSTTTPTLTPTMTATPDASATPTPTLTPDATPTATPTLTPTPPDGAGIRVRINRERR